MDLKEELINLIKDFQHGNKDSFGKRYKRIGSFGI